MQYTTTIKSIYSLNRWVPAKYGIQNMLRLHELLNFPIMNKPVIHVAGTNGKGSVSWKTARAFELAGFKTGLFVSPHISCYRERIQINRQYISEEEVTEILRKIFSICEKNNIPATFFELTTALALVYFERHADIVVLETGLGGRLDATNIFDSCLSIITSIGWDHEKILGSTLEQIALEKAGIIKKNRPVVLGPNLPVDVFLRVAKERNSPVILTPLPHHGQDYIDYDEENSMIVRTALKHLQKNDFPVRLTSEMIEEAVQSRPMCRFEVFQLKLSDLNINNLPSPVSESSINIILDAGHNSTALKKFVSKLHHTYGQAQFHIIFAASSDKDYVECFHHILAIQNLASLTLTEASHPRATPAEQLFQTLEKKFYIGSKFEAIKPVSNAVHHVIRHVAEVCQNSTEKHYVVICGTMFMLMEARTAIGIQEPHDSEEIRQVFFNQPSKPEIWVPCAPFSTTTTC